MIYVKASPIIQYSFENHRIQYNIQEIKGKYLYTVKVDDQVFGFGTLLHIIPAKIQEQVVLICIFQNVGSRSSWSYKYHPKTSFIYYCNTTLKWYRRKVKAEYCGHNKDCVILESGDTFICWPFTVPYKNLMGVDYTKPSVQTVGNYHIIKNTLAFHKFDLDNLYYIPTDIKKQILVILCCIKYTNIKSFLSKNVFRFIIIPKLLLEGAIEI